MVNLYFESHINDRNVNLISVVYLGLLSLMLVSVPFDVIFLEKHWFQLAMLKSILLLSYVNIFNLFQLGKIHLHTTLHIFLGTFTTFCLYIGFQLDDLYANISYFSLAFICFVGFNSVIIWNIKHSLFQYILAIILFVYYIYFGNSFHEKHFYVQQLFFFLILGGGSIFFPYIRRNNSKELINTNHYQKNKIKELNNTLFVAQNNFNSLQQLIHKKNNERKFVAQQINEDIKNLKKWSKENETSLEADKLNQLETLLHHHANECNMFFKPLSYQDFNYNLQLPKKSINLNEVIIQLLKNYRFQINSKNLQLTKKGFETINYIIAEEVALDIALTNIIEFILYYSYHHNEIEVKLLSQNNYSILTFKNFNHSISNKEIEEFSEDISFINFSKNRSNNDKKVGINIAKKLTENMGGYLEMISENKKGYEINLELKNTN